MALYLKQDENRSELQRKLAAELQEKAKKTSKIAKDLPDGVDDSEYMVDLKKTTSLAWVWVLIVIAFVVVILRLVIVSMPQY